METKELYDSTQLAQKTHEIKKNHFDGFISFYNSFIKEGNFDILMGKNVGLFCFLLSRVFLLLEINSLFPIDCHFRFNPSTAEGIGGTRSFQRGISRNSTRLDWRRNGWWYWFQKRCTRTTDKNNNSWSGSTKLFTGYPKWIRGNFKELPTCLDFGFFHLREKIMLVSKYTKIKVPLS